MDDLINAVIEANPRAEMSEVPPPKKARTTPTDTIETMEEPDSKIGTTIPNSRATIIVTIIDIDIIIESKES